MQLTHSFRIPVEVDKAWATLRDIERIAPCMPGATIDSVDGDDFTGGVKVKVGPITMTYRGDASFVEVDEEHHRAVIEAKGKETRGSGTARATVRAELRDVEGETEVTMVTDLAVTGKPAQFGRGVMADVGAKLIGQFASCLSSTLGAPEAPAEPPARVGTAGNGAGPGTADVPVATPPVSGQGTSAAPAEERTGPAAAAGATASPSAPGTGEASRQHRAAEAIDLLDVAGAPVLKRLGPLAGAIAGFLGLLWLLVRRRRRANGVPSRRQRRRAVKADRRLARADRKASKAENRAARAERGAAKAEHKAARSSRRQRRRTRRAERTVARAAAEPGEAKAPAGNDS